MNWYPNRAQWANLGVMAVLAVALWAVSLGARMYQLDVTRQISDLKLSLSEA